MDEKVAAHSGDVDQTLVVASHAAVNGLEPGALTPATEKELEAIRQVMANSAATASGADAGGTQMLNDLMRSMARKETQHRETVEAMSAELASLRKQNETLEALSKDQVANMAREIEDLRAQLADRSVPKASTSSRSLADELEEASAAELDSGAAGEIERLKQEHAAAMFSLKQQHADVLAKVQTSASIRSIPGELGDEEKGDPLAQGKDQATEAHLQAVTKAHNAQMQTLRDSHSRALQEVQTELETQHLSTLSEATREAEQAALAKHTVELQRLQQEHAEAASQMAEQLTALKTDHESVLEKLKADHASKLDRVLLDLQIVNSDRDETRRAYEELHASHQDMLAKIDIDPHEVDTLRAELNDTSDALVTLEAALTEAQEERDSLLIEIETIRQEAEAQQQDASLASSGSAVRDAAAPVPADAALKRELESHKSMLSKTRGDMTKLKVELQAARDECARHEQSVKDLQLRLATSETRSVRSHGSDSFGQHSQSEHDAAGSAASSAPLTSGTRSSLGNRRTSDYEPNSSFELRNHRPSVGSVKPPPPTPPPNMTLPPTPTGVSPAARTSAGVRTSTCSQVTRPDSPSNAGAGMMTRSSSMTSVTSPVGHMSSGGVDAKLTRLLSEQAEEIKNLAKQLNHCEADLQANIDLVATLEAALNDSERNLRKSRVQLAEVTRERERYAAEANAMRAQLNTAQSEVESVRNSVLIEKQGYESKIEEERQAKERARKALEARLEEVSKRKSSKLFCL